MVFGGQELDPDNIRKVEVVEIMKRETDQNKCVYTLEWDNE